MIGFLAIGFALFSGDLLPWTVRVLMLVGGFAALTEPFVPRSRPDPGWATPILRKMTCSTGTTLRRAALRRFSVAYVFVRYR